MQHTDTNRPPRTEPRAGRTDSRPLSRLVSRRDCLRAGLGLLGALAVPAVGGAASPLWGPDHRITLLPDFPVLEQPDRISCGPTCVAMLLQYYGLGVDIEDVKKTAGTRLIKIGGDEIGFTWPSKMREALLAHGLEAELLREAKLQDVVSLVEANRPPILLVRSSPKTWHYVVAVGHRGGERFRMADPLGKEYWLDAETLRQAWAFDGDLRGNPTPGVPCKVCRTRGKVGFLPCAFCAGDGYLPDFRRAVVEANLIERVAGCTMVVPAFSATPA